jgi:NADH-quinone oxidoreductase subunit M
MGIYPESFLAPMRQDVGVLLARIDRAAPPGDPRLVLNSNPGPRVVEADGTVPKAAEGAH